MEGDVEKFMLYHTPYDEANCFHAR